MPVSRFRLLDIVDNSNKKGTFTTLNAVAKENIHVRTKILVNLKLIGSWITRSQPKRVFHMRHSVAVFADKLITQIDLVGNLKSETAAEKRKIWQLKHKKGLQSVHFTPKASK